MNQSIPSFLVLFISIFSDSFGLPFYIGSFDEDNGIPNMAYALRRIELVNRLLGLVSSRQFAYLGSAPASGKTSLLCLLTDRCRLLPDIVIVNVSMLGCNDPYARLLNMTGIDVENQRVSDNIRSDKRYLIVMDDVQSCYDTVGLWTGLIKTNTLTTRWIPSNIQFILSATYALQTLISPLCFDDLPKLTFSDMLLSEDEAEEFLNLCIRRYALDQTKLGEHLENPSIRHVIKTHCNGLIGALCRTVRYLKEIFGSKPISCTSIINALFNTSMIDSFSRCFVTDLTLLSPDLQTFLQRMLFVPQLLTETAFQPGHPHCKLLRSGILRHCKQLQGSTNRKFSIVDQHDTIAFSSPFSARSINHLIFPQSLSLIDGGFGDAMDLLKLLVNGLSNNECNNVLTLKQLLLRDFHMLTQCNCYIQSNIHRYFPTSRDIGVPGAILDNNRCAFYLAHSSFRYVIEVLIDAEDDVAMHVLNDMERYDMLSYSDYAVVNICLTNKGNKVALQHQNYMMFTLA